MIQVMAALRRLVGIVGAGFEMLQDFVDEIFQGILPASFVAKYATKGFQAAMEARYSEPTSHTDDNGRARNHVPTKANARPISRIARVRNAAGKVTKYAQSLLNSPAGKATGILAIASIGIDLVQDIMQSEANERMAAMWPDNFTLFGYSDVLNKFDDLESFLLEDSTCYTVYQYERLNLTMRSFPCLDSKLSRYTVTNPTSGTTSIDATQCWADATPSIGQNSLFACTSTSTCCTSAMECGDGHRVTCGTCPEPAFAMTNRYGCHSSLRKCVCGTARSEVDRCTANLHCDAEAQCELVSSMNSMQYGTIPCKLCPSKSQVMCLLQSKNGMPGGCVCMLDSVVKLDLCSDMSNMETRVDSSRLCGYLHGQSSQSMVWSFDMDNIMLVSCAEVSTGICSTVYNTGGGGQTTVRMVVAASLRGLTTTSSGKRRLLQQDDDESPPVHVDEYERDMDLSQSLTDELLEAPGWNVSASPCKELVHAQMNLETREKMSVLERFELRRCVFWRFVGKRALERNNLTDSVLGGQDHAAFLVSADDFIRTVLSNDGAGMILLRNPGVFWSAVMYHPWMRPVRALGVMIANHLEHIQWVREIDYDVHEALFGGDDHDERGEEEGHNTQKQKQTPKDLLKRMQIPPMIRHYPSPPNTAAVPHADAMRAAKSHSLGRKLLQISVVDTVKDVQQYSGQIIQGVSVGSQPLVSTRVAGAWSTASFAWPPVYNYVGQTCPVALSALHLGRQAVLVVTMYFENFGNPRPPIDRSLRANLPNFTAWVVDVSSGVEKVSKEGLSNVTQTWASWVFHKGLDVAGVKPSHLVAFFTLDRKWTLSWILETSIKCDLASTVTCSRHDKDLVMSSVVFLLGYILLIRPVCNALGMGFLHVIYILSYPGFILWYVFGMPISCFPMIPTCLMSDIIATIEVLAPMAVIFPASLRCDGVLDVNAHPLNQTCLRSCSTLNFTGWVDPLAFAICDTDPTTCRYVGSLEGETGLVLFDTLVWSPLRESLRYFEGVVTKNGGVDLAGHRLCTWVSFVTTIPVLGVLGLGLLGANAVVAATLELLPSTIAFIGQLYIFFTAGG